VRTRAKGRPAQIVVLAVTGNCDHRNLASTRLDLPDEPAAVSAGHFQVCDYHVAHHDLRERLKGLERSARVPRLPVELMALDRQRADALAHDHAEALRLR
jgi:hypothetical protein